MHVRIQGQAEQTKIQAGSRWPWRIQSRREQVAGQGGGDWSNNVAQMASFIRYKVTNIVQFKLTF